MKNNVFCKIRSKIQWAFIRSWLVVIGFLGAGMLPCPDCGSPMIIHFWPVAGVIALRNIVRQRYVKFVASNSDDPQAEISRPDPYCYGSTNCVTPIEHKE